MRNLLIGSLLVLATIFVSSDSHAFKWQDYRQSENVIDVRPESKAVSAQVELEASRRLLVAMIMLAENDANLHPECVTLNQEIEKLKSLKTTLDGMETEPVRRLICEEKGPTSRLNLCAKAFADDPSAAPARPDLKKFGEELAQAYGPVMGQMEHARVALKTKEETFSKESEECRVGLQLIQMKVIETQDSYEDLVQTVSDLAKPRP